MKKDWDKLMATYMDHATILIGDVDCTADGEALCTRVGVEGYPTLKYGDPSNLEDFEGERDGKALKAFAKGLGPMCSPASLDMCDDEKKAQIQKFTDMSQADRDAQIAEQDAELKQVEADFKEFVEGLEKSYAEAEEKKAARNKAIKDAGLGLLKAVNSHVQKAKTEL